MSIMTKQELIKEIEKEVTFLESHLELPPDGYGGWRNEVVDDLHLLFLKFAREIIGEREESKLIERGKGYDVFRGDGRAIKERNELRSEQRKALDALE